MVLRGFYKKWCDVFPIQRGEQTPSPGLYNRRLLQESITNIVYNTRCACTPSTNSAKAGFERLQLLRPSITLTKMCINRRKGGSGLLRVLLQNHPVSDFE